MNWIIRYSKDDLARAKELGKECLAIGYNGNVRSEAVMYMDEEQIATLWMMAQEMNHNGKSPREALDIAEARIADMKARIAGRKAREAEC